MAEYTHNHAHTQNSPLEPLEEEAHDDDNWHMFFQKINGRTFVFKRLTIN
jgi:hypothetical protein